MMRKQSIYDGIDPAPFHHELWHRLKIDNMTVPLPRLATSYQNSRPYQSSNRFPPNSHSFRYSERYAPYQEHKTRPHQNRWRSPARCLLCAGPHPSRGCRAPTQINGRPVAITSQDEGKTFADSEGTRYCFAYNGTTGCTNNTCPKGVHRCTLCKGSDHGAQSCSSI
jgi:hypothetical protein